MSSTDHYNSKTYRGKYTGCITHRIEKPSGRKDCKVCEGCGQVNMTIFDEGEKFVERRECGKCGGTGEGIMFIYGFILPDDSSIGDVFAHHREIEPGRKGFKELFIGDRVEFDLVEKKQGPCAKNIIIKHKQNVNRRIIPGGNN